MARAIGSYPIGHGFKSNSRYHGPLVKRSRHRPFTAVTGVRFSHGSPKKESRTKSCFLFLSLSPNRLCLCKANSKWSVAKLILPRAIKNNTNTQGVPAIYQVRLMPYFIVSIVRINSKKQIRFQKTIIPAIRQHNLLYRQTVQKSYERSSLFYAKLSMRQDQDCRAQATNSKQ